MGPPKSILRAMVQRKFATILDLTSYKICADDVTKGFMTHAVFCDTVTEENDIEARSPLRRRGSDHSVTSKAGSE
jgi:hypothetical protein